MVLYAVHLFWSHMLSLNLAAVIGGSVCIGAVLGLVLLGEQMMMHGWSGVLMLCIGIGMVATDPGDKVEEGPVSSDEDVVGEAPAVLIWIAPALICASAYGTYIRILVEFLISDCFTYLRIHSLICSTISAFYNIFVRHSLVDSFPSDGVKSLAFVLTIFKI